MKKTLGEFLRSCREKHRISDKAYSLRQVAQRIGIEPSYLSKVERGENVSLSEEKLILLARDLGQDPDVVLALSGRVSSDLQEVIRKRPVLFARLLRELKNAPDHAVLRVVREVRDGEW
ncbi:MAG: helix-turn-helix domain-containing protein [Desulfovermiculus sp.]